MSAISPFRAGDAIRVKVKKCEGMLPPEYRKFSVDPQITSFEVLQSLLARAFDMKGEFSISYLAQDEEGRDTYIPLLSDWDLEDAFRGFSEPCLSLKVDLKSFEEGLEDWDVMAPLDITQNSSTSFFPERSSITGTIRNHMEKTINMVQRAFNFGDGENNLEQFKPLKSPMGDTEFHNFLDGDGRLIKPRELRLSVYQGGIEPSLRKVVWKHILNVYPSGLTAKERISYMKQMSCEYDKLRQTWQDIVASGNVTEEIHYVTSMVRKDVLRTDRTHKFYAGSDDNKNVVSLFNILITYALNHPSVSYCQGMSDLASPILVTMKDEAHAYVCFCALMQRLKPNFQLDGKMMSLNFQQLSELLQHYDSQFFTYLKNQGADDLLFCYRWLLLELKREFAFDDALRMLEVLWSSIPPSPPEKELVLFEELYPCNTSSLPSPRFNTRENPYTKVRAIRKQNSASSIRGLMHEGSKEKEDSQITDEEVKIDQPDGNAENESSQTRSASSQTENEPSEKASSSNQSGTDNAAKILSRRNSFSESNGDDLQDYLPMTTSITRELRMELENLNRQLPCSFLQRSITVDSEDLDSPRSPDFCQSSIETAAGKQNVDQSLEDDASESWTCDLSGIDQICRLGSSKKHRKKLPGSLSSAGKNETPVQKPCCSPEDAKRVSFEDRTKSSSDLPCNGEIFENEESDIDGCSCHLKSVIPIRLVHSPGIDGKNQRRDSDSSESLSESSSGRTESDQISFASVSNSDDSKSETVNLKGMVGDKHFEKSETSAHSVVECSKSVMTNSCEEALEYSGKTLKTILPPPYELGSGNPFMLFLCLTLLLQHRDIIMKSHMDYNELAMHFDKMVRKHNVDRVLHQARALFREYLQMGWHENSWGTDPHV